MNRQATMELGPTIGRKVADFSLCDYDQIPHNLDDLMGKQGLLLGFIGDIWHATSVRRILWLQHHLHKFAMMGTHVALLVREHTSTLYGFYMSSPLPVPFPLLSDQDGRVHDLYRMARTPGLLLIDTEQYLSEKWLMPSDRVWPKPQEIAAAIHNIELNQQVRAAIQS